MDEAPISSGKRLLTPQRDALEVVKSHLAQICKLAAADGSAADDSEDPGRVRAVVSRAGNLLTSAFEALDIVSVVFGDLEAVGIEATETPADEEDRGEEDQATAEEIGGVVVLARMDLRARQRALLGLASSASLDEQLDAASAAIRTVQRSLSAVDAAISEGAGMPRSVNYHRDTLARSLEVRRRYVTFYKQVARAAAPSAENLLDRLRSAGNAITILLGGKTAGHLRTGDRALLVLMRARIREHLAQPDPSSGSAAGFRLWQDVLNIATMFLDVNKREELILHDGSLARELLESPLLAQAEPSHEVVSVDTILPKISALRGRSPVLDALVDNPSGLVRLSTVRSVLLDIERALSAPSASSKSAFE